MYTRTTDRISAKTEAAHRLLAFLFLAGYPDFIVGRFVNRSNCFIDAFYHFIEWDVVAQVGRNLSDAGLVPAENLFRRLANGHIGNFVDANFLRPVFNAQIFQVGQPFIRKFQGDVFHFAATFNLACRFTGQWVLNLANHRRNTQVEQPGRRRST
jgi:hypothetical protein